MNIDSEKTTAGHFCGVHEKADSEHMNIDSEKTTAGHFCCVREKDSKAMETEHAADLRCEICDSIDGALCAMEDERLKVHACIRCEEAHCHRCKQRLACSNCGRSVCTDCLEQHVHDCTRPDREAKKKDMIKRKREAALLRKAAKVRITTGATADQSNVGEWTTGGADDRPEAMRTVGSATQEVLPANDLDEGIRELIAEKRREALLRRETKAKRGRAHSSLDDPEPDKQGEADEHNDDWQQQGSSAPEQPLDEQEQHPPKQRRLTGKAKHLEASKQLVDEKKKAADVWVQHGITSGTASEPRRPKVAFSNELNNDGLTRSLLNTHHRMMLRDIVFCRKFGCWSSRKTQNLVTACHLAPSCHDTKHKLQRMMRGLHPECKREFWNDGLSTSVATPPISLDYG